MPPATPGRVRGGTPRLICHGDKPPPQDGAPYRADRQTSTRIRTGPPGALTHGADSTSRREGAPGKAAECWNDRPSSDPYHPWLTPRSCEAEPLLAAGIDPYIGAEDGTRNDTIYCFPDAARPPTNHVTRRMPTQTEPTARRPPVAGAVLDQDRHDLAGGGGCRTGDGCPVSCSIRCTTPAAQDFGAMRPHPGQVGVGASWTGPTVVARHGRSRRVRRGRRASPAAWRDRVGSGRSGIR